MAKVLILSRTFPKGHIRQGEETEFVAKFWANHGIKMLNIHLLENDYINVSKIGNLQNPKKHTIRKGKRFKKGDLFSPRVWSSLPYRSKQIIISPDTEVKAVFDIEIWKNGAVFINGEIGKITLDELSKNDGLNRKDFDYWFVNNLPFEGQIICWNTHNINY